MPISISKTFGLPNGQPTFPTSEEVRRNTLRVRIYKFFLGKLYGWILNPGQGCFKRFMANGWFGAEVKNMVDCREVYPEELQYMLEGIRYQSSEALMYLMAQDVILDCAGVDFRKVKLKGKSQAVVWYASDDEDCPPSHGECIAKHFDAQTRVLRGHGHVGGAVEDMCEFFERLVGGT